MKLTRFKIENFRSIDDSGWVEVTDIAVIVGKNESGKTSLLKALWKFNPYKKQPYNLDREWPRGRRKDKSADARVATVEFEFDQNELDELHAVDECTKEINGVVITKDYKGSFHYSFLPAQPGPEHDLRWAVSILEENFGVAPDGASQHFKAAYQEALKELIQNTRQNGGAEYVVQNAPRFKKALGGFVSPTEEEKPQDQAAVAELSTGIDAALAELNVSPPTQRIADMAHEWLPTFIYMDDYRVFNGSAQLDQVKQHRDTRQMTDEDETVIMLIEQAGLSLDDEVAKGVKQDREQRMLDMDDASQTLTREIADRWTQRRYAVKFQADGQHLMTFVKDADGPGLVPLEERSIE